MVAICTLTFVVTELYRRYGPKNSGARFASEGARIQHREALRKPVLEEIYKCRAEGLRQDVIVRHVDRVDSYPDIDPNAKGIFPWFRVGMVDMYERGIVLCLRIGGLKESEDGYRLVDYVNNEPADFTAWLMANVPYDSIAAINFEGDKYYHYPHIFCYYDFNGEPYERKWFAQKVDQPHGHPYFKEIASYEEVARNNPEGQLWFE